METQTLHFAYDPHRLVMIVLQRHVEDNVQGKFYKAKQFAHYDYLFKVLEDNNDLLDEILTEYSRRNNVEVITLSDWRTEARLIWEVIVEREDYKEIENTFLRRGSGHTGMGVYDRAAKKFYECTGAQHFRTIREIVEREYPQMTEALDRMYLDSSITEWGPYSRDEIESFIMGNFELCGATKPLHEYM